MNVKDCGVAYTKDITECLDQQTQDVTCLTMPDIFEILIMEI